MKALGLDIGTTTVSAVIVDEGRVTESVTEKNGYFVESEHPWEKAQDIAAIEKTALDVVDRLLHKHGDVTRIGVTGQMHGIVYLDACGTPLSPLYTWQDGRGDLPHESGKTYAETLSAMTGYTLATGYGAVTHFYNLQHGLVPKDAAVFCTVHDYIAMRLCGAVRPVTDATDAASFGLFDVENGCFDAQKIKTAGMDPLLFPTVTDTPVIGKHKTGACVTVAIGDNQASFLGALDGEREGMLLNIGTGSQFSAFSPVYMTAEGLETRPFPGGGVLLVGASLCGGRAYALLADFFRMAGEMLGSSPENVYAAMDREAAKAEPLSDPITVKPLFSGTRTDPSLRASITGLSTENFTPRHLITGTMEGMAGELFAMYESYLAAGGKPLPLYGSGNGLRKNPYLQRCFVRLFASDLILSTDPEEAAKGAALYALQN